MVFRMVRFLRPFAGQVAAATVLGGATVACGIGLMATAAFLISTAALKPSIADLQVAIVGVRFFGLFRGVFRYLERLASHRLTLDLLTRLRIWFFAALEPLAPARTCELRSGDLLARAVADVESLQEFYVRVLAAPLVAVVVGIGSSALLGAFSPRLALAFAPCFAVTAVLVPVATHRLGRRAGRRLAALRADFGAAAVDGIQGIAELLACGAAPAHRRRFAVLSQDFAKEREKEARIEALGAAAVTVLTHSTVWCVLILAIPLVRDGVISGVSLAIVGLAAMAAFEAVQPLPAVAQHLEGQKSAASRVFAVLDARPAVRETGAPAALSPTTASADLEAKGVEFIYPGSHNAAISGLDIELRAGQRLAVVGPSGAGKSTFARLLLRFWDPSTGTISLAGRPLSDYRLDDLRSFVGVLEQRTNLFTGTVRDNLLVARPDSHQWELEKAAAGADLLDTIRGLPEGWDTWIGEQGLLLSGGQRRRLAIARLLLRGPSLVILDEPTTSLDSASARRMMRSLQELMQGRTTILISHRLVDLGGMDQILVLDRGRVVERGTHQTLIGHGGLFQQLYEAQHLELGEDGRNEL